MEQTLLFAGIACIMAAIVGGGLKAFGVEIQAVQSRVRQGALAALGVLLIVAARAPGLVLPSASSPATPVPTAVVTRAAPRSAAPTSAAPTASLAQPPPTVAASGTSSAPDGRPFLVSAEVGRLVRISFSGQRGQRVSIVQRSLAGQTGPNAQAGCLGTSARLVAPDERELASADNCDFIDATALPVDGTYVVQVTASTGNRIDLTMAIHDVPPDTEGSLSVGGPRVAVTTAAPGQRARFAFVGKLGQRIALVQRTAEGALGPSTQAGCLNEVTRLLRPDGQELASTNSCAALEPVRLPVDATYTVEVRMIDPSSADFTIELIEAS